MINRQSPNILYAAMYEKDRMPWQLVLGGPGTGLYRSDDGGEKWERLAGGLPTGTIGRIGIDIYQKNPNHPVRGGREPERATGRHGRRDRRRASRAAGRGRGGAGDDAEPRGAG